MRHPALLLALLVALGIVAGGVLFFGDSADASRDGQVKGAPWLFTEDTAQDRLSLIHLADRLRQEGTEVKALIFSHSGALTRGLEPLITFARQP